MIRSRASPAFAWGRGNEITTCFSSKDTSLKASQESGKGGSSQFRTTRWGYVHAEGYAMVAEGHARFCALHANLSLMQKTPLLLQTSRHYRILLRSYAMKLLKVVQTGHDMNGVPVSSQNLSLYSQLSKRAHIGELVWELIEIMNFSKSLFVTGYLSRWLQTHFSADVRLHDIRSANPPESHPKYWSLLEQYILHGRIEEARDLLAAHSESGRNKSFSIIDMVLHTMPRLTSNVSPNGFYGDWKKWHENTIGLLQTHEAFQMKSPARRVLKLISGDENALADASLYWYTLLVGHLLYVAPIAKTSELHIIADRCRESFGLDTEKSEEDEPLDRILLAVFKGNIVLSLRLLIEHVSSWWIAAHLCDLLTLAGCIDTYKLGSGLTLHEQYIMEYGWSLLGNEGLWSITMDYLAAAGPIAGDFVALLLDSEDPEDDSKALQLVHGCERHELASQLKTIQLVMGAKKIAVGRSVAGIYWLMLAQDIPRLSQLCDKLIDECVVKQTAIADLDSMVEHLGEEKFVFSEKLSFLSKYCELQSYLKENEIEKVTEIVLHLFSSELAPRRLWSHLLVDICLPILEASSKHMQPAFTVDQTYALMRKVEALTLSHRKDHAQQLASGKSRTLVRLSAALTQNLSNALLLSTHS